MKLRILLTVLSLLFVLVSTGDAKTYGFQTVRKVELDLEDIPVAYAAGFAKIPDGFIIAINASRFGTQFSLLKFSNEGKLLKTYEKRGNGPGELRAVSNILVNGDTLLVSERTAPYVHELTLDFKFVRDYRIKRGGNIYQLGKYYGIWGVNITGKEKNLKKYMLALYDSKTFEFKKYAYEVADPPPFVSLWGNIVPIGNNRFAGVYCNQYQIDFFDEELNLKDSMKLNVPDGMKKYSPGNKNPSLFNAESKKWMDSWLKYNSITYIDGKFILRYSIDDEMKLDVFSRDGKRLILGLIENEIGGVVMAEPPYAWCVKYNSEYTKATLVQSKITTTQD
jgi:hypothetical protein